MTWVATAIIGGAVIGGALSSKAQTSAAKTAAEAQTSAASEAAAAELEATQLSIDEQRRQFDAIQELLAPYTQAGTTALTSQMALAGLSGDAAQKQAIAQLEASPTYEAMIKAGEEGILQNAAATGGLRGGNVETALAEFRPSVLSQLIESQYSKLSGISSLGQASAAGTAQLGQATSGNISSLLQQMGQSQSSAITAGGNAAAQQALVSGAAQANFWGDVGSAIGLATSKF